MTALAALAPQSEKQHPEYAYLNLLTDILANGMTRTDRTGTGTIGAFGRQIRFDISEQFPLLTTKKVHFKSVAIELLWFLQGNTNVRWLQEHGVSIWNEWANEEGDLGPVYGKQWRSWAGPNGQVIDQMAKLIHNLQHNPFSRRHIISAWNPADVDHMALPPCHCLFQFYVHPDKDGNPAKLSCQLYQRSADLFLGVPFNIASYSLLTLMLAKVLGLKAGEFVHSFGDVHIYSNHLEQVKLQLSRTPKAWPIINIADKTDLFGFAYEDFRLEGYDPHPPIKAPVAV